QARQDRQQGGRGRAADGLEQRLQRRVGQSRQRPPQRLDHRVGRRRLHRRQQRRQSNAVALPQQRGQVVGGPRAPAAVARALDQVVGVDRRGDQRLSGLGDRGLGVAAQA